MFKHKIVEVSVLVNTPAASLNRDINGSPKTVVFGGGERARLSSQSIKYAIRKSDIFIGRNGFAMSERTCDIPTIIWEKIKDKVDAKYEGAVIALLKTFGTNAKSKADKDSNDAVDEENLDIDVPDGKDARTQIIAWDKKETEALAEIVIQTIESTASLKAFTKVKSAEIEKLLKDRDIYPTSIDVAFFGRMVSSDGVKNVPASVHIAHAFSTNRVTQEIDFFTAVDDHNNSTGAAMLGDSEYNASCFLKYGVIDLTQMYENLRRFENWEEIMSKGLVLLLESFCEKLPGGKQATFASYTLPCTIMVEVKDVKKPFNPCNAYEVPVKINSNESISEKSAEILSKFMDKMDKKYAIESTRFWFDVNDVTAPARTYMVAESLKSLYEGVSKEIFE